MRAAAVLCVRNESAHIRSAMRDLIAEGVDVVLIDHDSTDGTVTLAREFLGRGLLGIERMPWRGSFSLREQLEAKWRVIDSLDHDWIVHADADEWLSAPVPGETLLDGLRAADEAGYNCVHFDEFVFLPSAGEDLTGTDYRRAMTRYYFYRVEYPFLLRAWKNRAGLDNRRHAGHLLTGAAETRPFPADFPLRHYIVLSEAHAREKYLGRPFDPSEIDAGWHADRLRVTAENLHLPDPRELHQLSSWSSKAFDRGAPRATHFWEWPPAREPGARAVA